MKCKILTISLISLIGIAILIVLYFFMSVKYQEYVTNKENAKIETQLAKLKNTFEINEDFISGYFSDDNQSTNSWNGHLWNNKFPERVCFSVNFDIKNKKIFPIDSFLLKYEGIINQVKKVKVLMNYIQNNPDSKLEIRFVNNSSLSEIARKKLHEDLVTNFKNNAIDSLKTDSNEMNYQWILKNLDSAVYCHLLLPESLTYNSYFSWIILPNNRLLLRSTDKMIFSDKIFNSKGDIEINKEPIIIFDYNGNRIIKNEP